MQDFLDSVSILRPHPNSITTLTQSEQTITYFHQERPIPLLNGQALFLVCREISLEARAVLYGRNKFLLESSDSIKEIQDWLVEIGPTNRGCLRTLSVDLCRPIDTQVHHSTLEYMFYQINMPCDSDQTPEELREELTRMEKLIKGDILSVLQLLSGAGNKNLNDLTLCIPGDDQGRQMLYRYDNDFYFRGDLLEDVDMRKAILDIGQVELLSIGRTESQELAVGVARAMGVKTLSVRWVRAHFEREEAEPRWNSGGWVQDEDMLGAKIELSAELGAELNALTLS
jgi:hypothetical protein